MNGNPALAAGEVSTVLRSSTTVFHLPNLSTA